METRKEKIKRSFSESAGCYDRCALLQQEVMKKLSARLRKDYENILDIGSGTGALAGMLAEKYPRSEIIGIDIAEGMVEVACSRIKNRRVKFATGDGEALPFEDRQFDLVISSLSIQWMDPAKVFAEVARVLKPDGEFYFTTFGPATLSKLREVGLSINDFPHDSQLNDLLVGRFKRVKIFKEVVTKRYLNIFDFFYYLKNTGAQNPYKVERKGLLTKKKLLSLFSEEKGEIAANYEIFYGFCLL